LTPAAAQATGTAAVSGRVDLHTHVLPAIDEGARDDAAALTMLRLAAADGTRVLVATPHGAACQRERVIHEVERLADLARAADIPLRLLAGSEQRLTADLPTRLRAGEVATIADTPWLLVELALDASWPTWFDEAIYAAQTAGAWPILAHAERYPAVQRAPHMLLDAAAAGVLIQINAATLLGRSGASARRAAEHLLRLRLVHLIASDAHSPDRRPPLLAEAFARVDALCGPTYAQEIASNAHRIIAGESVTPGEPRLAEAGKRRGIPQRMADWLHRRGD
jgi:protein-tyrosine phosphatase